MIELIILLFMLAIAIFGIVYGIKLVLKPFQFEYETFFLSGNVNHNEITKIKRGKCKLIFTENTFVIEQNNEKIEDNCPDIYNMRIWEYKGGVYLAINMKTHSEYMFSLMEPNEDKSADFAKGLIYQLFKGISKKIKVELVECGESTESEDDEE